MDRLRTPRGVPVDPSGVRYQFARGGGPGGQHVNTSATKVTVVLDVDAALPPAVAARIRERHGRRMRATSSVHRSQTRNREAALARLLDRIDEALEERAPRTPTAVPRRARERRRADKARRARRLREREIPPE